MSLRVTAAIAHKELLENVLSWRFLIALVLSTLILVTSVLALGASYAEDEAAYQARVAEMERDENRASSGDLELLRALGRPNPLGIFVDGPGNDLRREEPTGAGSGTVQVRSGGNAFFTFLPAATSGGDDPQEIASGSAAPVNQRFAPLDLGFVAVVVLTFTAMVFSYDAVSGERERGTLKLILANPVPKDLVLVGKYLGGMASILLPFAVSVLVALAALRLRGLGLGGDEWLRLGLIVLLALPLASAFYLLGVFVSSLVKRSSTSLVALALVWLVLVFGAGNVAAVVAKETAGVSQEEIAQRHAEIDDRYAARLEDLDAEIRQLQQRQFQSAPAQIGPGGGNFSVGPSLPPEDAARLQALLQERDGIREEVANARAAVLDEARRRLDAQLERAEAIARLSPAEAYASLATSLARSDYWSYKVLSSAAEEYRREVDRARSEWLQDNPPTITTTPMGGGGGVRFQAPSMTSTFQAPEFHHAESAAAEELSSPSGVKNLLVLLAYNAGGFVAAYVALLRYDVR